MTAKLIKRLGNIIVKYGIDFFLITTNYFMEFIYKIKQFPLLDLQEKLY